LWRSQLLYESDWGAKTSYDLIRTHSSYFENLFEALGYRLVGRPIDRFVGLVAIDPPPRQTMKLDESLMLLVLRLHYGEALQRFETNDALEVETEGESLLQLFEERSRRERPGVVRVHEILREFKQRGLVRYGEQEDTRKFTIFIRPAVAIVVAEETLASLEAFVASDMATRVSASPAGMQHGAGT
jgi:hypothetical protein